MSLMHGMKHHQHSVSYISHTTKVAKVIDWFDETENMASQ